MFKIAYAAGHWIGNPKGIPTYMGLGDIREWTLNDQVAYHFARAALEYEDVEILRLDDPAGKTAIELEDRAAAANKWCADFVAEFHHNGGIKGGTGGGVVAFSYPGSAKGREYRDAIYEAVIAAGGLKGDRYEPVQEKAFDILRFTYAPAVLMEYGFMDSKTDAPTIVTDDYSKLVAYATMEGIAKVAGLKKKSAQEDKPAEAYTLKQFIRDVQEACGASVDGIAGPETLSKTVTISAQKNRTHAVVKPVQKRLAALGYTMVGEADGIAGTKFTAAVTEFQADNKCWIDGEITAANRTWKVLLGM